jgi:hypothetical protein
MDHMGDWLDRDDLTEAEIREHMRAEDWQTVEAEGSHLPPGAVLVSIVPTVGGYTLTPHSEQALDPSAA